MMKLATILLIFLVACRKDFKQDKEISHAVVQSEFISEGEFIGDPTRTPDLTPVLLQKDFLGNDIGVESTGGGYPFAFQGYSESNDKTGTWLRYRCPIENIGVSSSNSYSPLLPYQGDTHYSGADFIYGLHKDSLGVFHGITNPQFLYRVVFQHGIPVSLPSDNYKINFEGLDLGENYLFKPALNNYTFLNYYGFGDTIVIHPMFFDEYDNDVKIPDAPLGKYVVVVTVNQENYYTHQRLFRENDYSNNTVALPVQINGLGLASVDPSALSENRPIPVDSIRYTVIGRGKIKQIQLNWFCPYHQYHGVIHKFRVKKNGIVISDDLWTEGYTDSNISGRNITYSVEIKIEGLGVSPPTSITIKK